MIVLLEIVIFIGDNIQVGWFDGGGESASDGLAWVVRPGRGEGGSVGREAVAARADAELGEGEAGTGEQGAPGPTRHVAVSGGLTRLVGA